MVLIFNQFDAFTQLN